MIVRGKYLSLVAFAVALNTACSGGGDREPAGSSSGGTATGSGGTSTTAGGTASSGGSQASGGTATSQGGSGPTTGGTASCADPGSANLLPFDPPTMGSFEALYTHTERTSGEMPTGWSANCWAADGQCRVFSADLDGVKAVGLDNEGGTPSVMMYQWDVSQPDVPPGDYVFVVEFYLEPGVNGSVHLEGSNIESAKIELADQYESWVTATHCWTQEFYGKLEVKVFGYGMEPLYVRTLKLAKR